MNRLGIIFAMREELDEFLKMVSVTQEYSMFDLTFYECEFEGKQLILTESGIGKVNSARCCQILIDNMEVEGVFNVGVAGGIDPDIHVLDIVIGEKLVQHDFNLKAFDRPRGYIPNIGDVYISSDQYFVHLAEEVKTTYPVHKGVIASGDIFCYEEDMSRKIHDKFHAYCVEMEGASIAQVCYLSHVPFLVVRAISDSVGEEDNKLTYEEFLEKSSKRVAEFLKEILSNLE